MLQRLTFFAAATTVTILTLFSPGFETGADGKFVRGFGNTSKGFERCTFPLTEYIVVRKVEGENLKVTRLYNEAAVMSPDDVDVHIVLGVLYNLSREYDKAIAAFERALKLKPQDYSLWNKLGATQANSVQSADAIMAYQQALDLKPNYVRAWANMGISYANQGMYDESVRYYVRALAMNPKAENAWQYLRISLSCASRNDMLEACDSRNLDLLQKEFPLQ